MAVTTLCIIEAKDAAAAITTQYTASSANRLRTIIDRFTGNNYSGLTQTLSVYLVPFGGAAGPTNLIKSKTIAASECYTFPEIVGHTLNPGDFIATNCTLVGSINIRSSGRETTT